MRGGWLFALGLATAVQAEAPDLSALNQEALLQTLLRSGINIRAEEKHEVAVDDCQMTTFWWKLQQDDTWMLWSSFQFEMATATLQESSFEPGVHVLMAYEGAGSDDDMAMFFFSMRNGVEARYELPFARRAPKEPQVARPSPRGDGTSHYYDSSTSFFIRHENPGIGKRARTFGAAYMEWVRRYCMLAS